MISVPTPSAFIRGTSFMPSKSKPRKRINHIHKTQQQQQQRTVCSQFAHATEKRLIIVLYRESVRLEIHFGENERKIAWKN